MKRDAAEVLKAALALPTETRAALAESLLESLDTEVDEDAEAAWAAEVNRRITELDSGAVKTIPGRKCAADSRRTDASSSGRSSPAGRGRRSKSLQLPLRLTNSHDSGTHRQRNSAQEN
jgi:putative addiction module component (TIGR02574 family)